MRLRLIISAAIAAVATYSAIVRDARRQSFDDRPAPRGRRGPVTSGGSHETREGARTPAPVRVPGPAESGPASSSTLVTTLPGGPIPVDESRTARPMRRASARWQALPPAPVAADAPHEPSRPLIDPPDAPITGKDADVPEGPVDAGPPPPADGDATPRPPDVRAPAAAPDEPETPRSTSDVPGPAPRETTDDAGSGTGRVTTHDDTPPAGPTPMGGFSPMGTVAEAASSDATVVASGEFAISGTSHGPGQGTITAVTYRRPLDDVASPSDIRLEVNHAVNVAPQGLFVLGDEGFAPNGDGFVLMLLAAESGAFSARGTYRVYI